MTRSFKHPGLKRLYEDDDAREIGPDLRERTRRILTMLSVAAEPEEMNLPGFRLHALKGDMAGFWAVTVGANWRIIFRFEGADVFDVELIDYHGAHYADEKSRSSRRARSL